jgi:hypothetical protein
MNETLNNKFTLKMLFTVLGFQELIVTPCTPLEVDRRFRGTCLLHPQS